MPMAGFQILSLDIFFKRGCLLWDIKNYYYHILRFKTRSGVYYSGKQIHPMLRNHSNFLGIEEVNHGKATRFFSCGKKIHPKNTHKRLNPSLLHALRAQVHCLWTLATFSMRLQRKTYNRPQILKKLPFEICLTLHKLLWTQCLSSSSKLCSGLWMLSCKAHFKSAGCLLELKKSGNDILDRKTDWVSFWPRKMTY